MLLFADNQVRTGRAWWLYAYTAWLFCRLVGKRAALTPSMQQQQHHGFALYVNSNT
jgi:hypothetical protein